jgi:hypothetical protein
MPRGLSSRKVCPPDPHSVLEHEQAINLTSRRTVRRLVNEPLAAEDWAALYTAHRAFVFQVRLIVAAARARAGLDPGFDPGPVPSAEVVREGV